LRITLWTTALLVAAVLVAAVLIGACGVGGGGGGGNGDANGGAAAASCDGIQALESYRYRFTIKLQSPAFEPTSGATPAPPLTAFADTLAALLSDFTIDGAHVAPDRTQAILKFQQDEVEIRAIGNRSWVSVGGAFEQQESSGDAALLTPDVVCRDIVQEIVGSLGEVDSTNETINGIETKHYELNEADLERLPELLGTDPNTDLPEKFQVDVWLARDGRWPVRLEIGAEDKDEQGEALGLSVSMEIRDVNDPGISVVEPATASGN
jgi:hypothetical protein